MYRGMVYGVLVIFNFNHPKMLIIAKMSHFSQKRLFFSMDETFVAIQIPAKGVQGWDHTVIRTPGRCDKALKSKSPLSFLLHGLFVQQILQTKDENNN